MKSETQNIYNFCMEKKKKKNVKHTHTQKVRNYGNYFLLCWLRSDVRKKKKETLQKYCHFFICS